MDPRESDLIDYEELIREYNESLNSVLRGFRPKHDFLELWVPDSNHSRSVKNLVESARDHGRTTISIYFSNEILKQLNWEPLMEEMQKYGKVEQGTSKGGKTVHINRGAATGRGEGAGDIHPLYKEHILELAQLLTHQGSILEDGDCLLIRSTKDGISLFGAIDTTNHTIHRARHSGTNKTVESALLEGLCQIIEGLPIQEAHDHGIIKLEYRLRDKTKGAPVPGIANVFNYPPMFDLPIKLMRDLYQTYVSKTGYKAGDNFYHTAVSKEWKSLSETAKLGAVDRVFKQLLQKENTPYAHHRLELQIMGMELNHKINIAVQGEIAPEARAKLFMDFERALRRELEPTLEVFSQNVKDRNAIRRLNN